MDKFLVAEKVRRNCQRKVCSALLALGMASTCWLLLPLQAATPEPSESIQLKENRERKQPLTWAEIWKKLFGRQQKQGGGRGPEEMRACAPNRTLLDVAVWTNKPLFVWQGDVREISLSRVGGKEKVNLWKHPIAESSAMAQRKIYDGLPLQPGETYEWQLIDKNLTNSTRVSAYFQTIPAKRSSAIAKDLTELETTLKASGASAEDIALHRANYFAARNLWLDILPEVFSVKNPSPALDKIIRELPTEFCQPGTAKE